MGKAHKRTYQVQDDIGYSSFEEPFYITALTHKGQMFSADFSTDGKQIITSSWNKTAKLWDLKGKPI